MSQIEIFISDTQSYQGQDSEKEIFVGDGEDKHAIK